MKSVERWVEEHHYEACEPFGRAGGAASAASCGSVRFSVGSSNRSGGRARFNFRPLLGREAIALDKGPRIHGGRVPDLCTSSPATASTAGKRCPASNG